MLKDTWLLHTCAPHTAEGLTQGVDRQMCRYCRYIVYQTDRQTDINRLSVPAHAWLKIFYGQPLCPDRFQLYSLIHSLMRPLSFPLLTGESLRGLPLEFLPCAFYPLLSHAHTDTRTHTYARIHSPTFPDTCQRICYEHICITGTYLE